MRQLIFNKLSTIYPTFAIGQHKGLCKSPYLVVKFNEQNVSTSTDLGGWQIFEVMVYIPDKSIVKMEQIIAQIKNTLVSELIEHTNKITPDYHDETVQAYTRSIQFRQPKGL